jgi:hypothetical protein
LHCLVTRRGGESPPGAKACQLGIVLEVAH